MNLEFFLGLGLGVSILLIAFAYFSVFRVEEGFIAVMTAFGRAESEGTNLSTQKNQNAPLSRRLKIWGSGLHFKWPWKKVFVVSMMERHMDLSGSEGGRTAMTSDGVILRLDSKLRYSLNREELYEHLFQLKDPMEHIKGLFTCLLRNEIANFRGEGVENVEVSYDRIRCDLKGLNRQIEMFCKTEIAGKYGVNFDTVDLTDILPPDELAEALNAVINAQTETQTQYARAEAECQQQLLSAKQGVEIAKARAQAVETEIKTFAGFINKLHEDGTLADYLERRASEVHMGARTVFARRPL